MAICDGIRAMDVLINRIGMQDRCRIRLAVALAEQRGRCHVGGGDSVMDPGLLLAALDPIGPSSRWPSAHI